MAKERSSRQKEEPEEAAAEASAVQSEDGPRAEEAEAQETAPRAEEVETPQTAPSAEEAGAAQTAPPGEEREAPAREAAPARPERRRRGRPGGRRKVCSFCVEHTDIIDYKDPLKLRRYLSDRGRIEPRRKTGTCAKHQRRLSVALKRARHLALLPYTADHIRETGVFAPRTPRS